jgi:hypothetical protein
MGRKTWAVVSCVVERWHIACIVTTRATQYPVTSYDELIGLEGARMAV